MAYPTISAPYGLVPVGLIGGQAYAGGTRQMKIANNYGTAIGKGDLVKRVNTGLIERDAVTTAVTATGSMGVFMGCKYTDPNTNQLTFNNQYPGSIAADDIFAFVCDDPDVVFKVACCSSGETIASVARTALGNNIALINNTLETTNGISRAAADSTTEATTSTLPFKVIDVVEDTKTGSDAFVEILVMFNPPVDNGSNVLIGGHAYHNPVGI